MTVIRINKTKDYVTMSNYHLKEKQMSLKAKGLLSEMLALPNNWEYSIQGLVAINKENECSIKTTLDELKRFKYLIVTKKLPNETKTGRIEYIYDIYEKPKQEGEKQGLENQGVEFQPVEYLKQYNINNKVLNNNILNNNINNEFEKLWELYPRKIGKKNALKNYIKARKNYSFEQIKNGIVRYLEFIKDNNIQEQYIKHGATWFNQECWNDTYNKQELPSWFNQDISKKQLTSDEQQEIDKILEDF